MNNRDKFKEIFGIDINKGYICRGGLFCPHEWQSNSCKKCEYKDYWNQEYKEPSAGENEVHNG